jgi:hypothetical protein
LGFAFATPGASPQERVRISARIRGSIGTGSVNAENAGATVLNAAAATASAATKTRARRSRALSVRLAGTATLRRRP